jgi:hypothetical protein
MTVPVHYKWGVANRRGIGLGCLWMVPCKALMGWSQGDLNLRIDTVRR